MAISVTNIGTGTATATTATVTSVTTPAGVTIIVGASDGSSGAPPGSSGVADGTNTYTAGVQQNGNNSTAGGTGSLFYSAGAAALSAATITYTTVGGSANCGLSACYATGLAANPFDAAVKASAGGSSATATVTSGTPSQAGDLMIGWAATSNATIAITQDSGHGWASPPNAENATNNRALGGNQVRVTKQGTIYAPTLSPSGIWSCMVIGFKAAAQAVGQDITIMVLNAHLMMQGV